MAYSRLPAVKDLNQQMYTNEMFEMKKNWAR